MYRRIDEVAERFHNGNETAKVDPSLIGSDLYPVHIFNYNDLKITDDECAFIVEVYIADHPLYYWISYNYLLGGGNYYLCTTGRYAFGSERAKFNKMIYDGVKEYLAAASSLMNEYELAKVFHDEIIVDMEYSHDAADSIEDSLWTQTVLALFERGEGVCATYAKTFSLMMNYAGVENVFVTGHSTNEPHGWNLVKMDDGEWYWFDLTWDDPKNNPTGIRYNYFCKTDNEIGSDGKAFIVSHVPNDYYPLPERATRPYGEKDEPEVTPSKEPETEPTTQPTVAPTEEPETNPSEEPETEPTVESIDLISKEKEPFLFS
ncbi:MAG: hypothetical protein II368_06500 [Clostridia bacterium]|nr:hypothetical protein [Clostridia bacterium]